MSELSEKDIITYLKNSLNDEFNFKNCTRTQDKTAIQGLLDLYKKEKQEKEKFKKALGKRITYCNELEKDLFENCSKYVISKEKIREKIEELRKIHEERDFTNKEAYYLDCYNELLEERS